MAFERLNTDLSYISKLDDEPNDLGGLSPAELKAEFDKAGNQIKDFINAVLLPELEGKSGASGIGLETVAGLTGASTVQQALEKLVTMLQEITQGSVADQSITSEKLADAAVTAVKLANLCVGTAALQNLCVTTGKLDSGAVTTGKLAGLCVTAEKLAEAAVISSKLADKAVSTAKIADKAVGTEQIDDLAVTGSKLFPAAITADKLAPESVSRQFSASLGTDWIGSEAPYTQTIALNGIRPDDSPIVDILTSESPDTAQAELEDWGKIYRIDTGTDSLTVYATEPSTAALNIQLKAVRK